MGRTAYLQLHQGLCHYRWQGDSRAAVGKSRLCAELFRLQESNRLTEDRQRVGPTVLRHQQQALRELPSGTVTFLFTDIEGSTRLLSELGEGYAQALAAHRQTLRGAFARNRGVEVDTQGDAFFVAFERASDAVATASEASEALAGGPIHVRMGIHTGEPTVTDEGYVGFDVHRAARVCAAGHGGQVLLTESTRELLGELELLDLGAHRLKDLAEPLRLYQLGTAEFPPLRTLDATNLPVGASPLLGRETEIGELVSMLLDGDRLVTVTGPGGTGKTRLALQVAAELVGALKDGVYWVPLA